MQLESPPLKKFLLGLTNNRGNVKICAFEKSIMN